ATYNFSLNNLSKLPTIQIGLLLFIVDLTQKASARGAGVPLQS
ncbi:MAG: hypothetical protein ACI89U_002532, partial [Gammaproteobacteria bacterium]